MGAVPVLWLLSHAVNPLTTRATRGRGLSVLSLSPAHNGIRQCPSRHGSCSRSSTWDWKQQQLLQSGFQEIRDD